MNDTLAAVAPPGTGNYDGHPDNGSAATRHLCAGVYVDRTFRELIIRRIHNDARHRMAPSYGSTSCRSFGTPGGPGCSTAGSYSRS
jgi:hypothetical protein